MIPNICKQKHKAAEREIRRIVKGYKPEKVIIFGSLARGDINRGSDLDLILIKETEERFDRRIETVLKYVKGEIGVEPIIYTRGELSMLLKQKNDFLETVLAEGKVVYEKQRQ
ncbi:MAG: nucleotidyltransferase domain-containing protein [Candidatus Edwardsbacteria bacterium]